MTRKNVAASKASPKRDPAYDWAVALDQYLDLHDELMQCQAAMTNALVVNNDKQAWLDSFPDMDPSLRGILADPYPDSEQAVKAVRIGTEWLLMRYKNIWEVAPIPHWMIPSLIERAIREGTWAQGYDMSLGIATTIVHVSKQLDNRVPKRAYAEVFERGGDIRAAWSELDRTRFILPRSRSDFSSITLHIRQGASKEDALEALNRAWPQVEKIAGRPPGKRSRGKPIDYQAHVDLYCMWQTWHKKTGQGKRRFIDALSVDLTTGERQLQLAHWPTLPSEQDMRKQLKSACAWLEPDNNVPTTLNAYIEQLQPNS